SAKWSLNPKSRVQGWLTGLCDSRIAGRMDKPDLLPISDGPPFKDSRTESCCQSGVCRMANVADRIHPAQTQQEGDSNRKLRIWICFCSGNGADPVLVCEVRARTGEKELAVWRCGFTYRELQFEAIRAQREQPRAALPFWAALKEM